MGLFLAGSASAQNLGTYCSGKTADGKWGFVFGQRTVGENCALVRQGLSRITPLPIEALSRGYYDLNNTNAVFVRCGFRYRNVIKSIGGYALQNAYITARNSQLTHCMFVVNDW